MHVLSGYCLYLEGPIPWLHGNDVLTSTALNSLGTFLDWPQSLMSIFFSKTDSLSKIEIYKLYLEVEVLG